MTADKDFAAFLCRVRAGDEQAARELVRRYEAAIRLEVRVRLRQRQLRRYFDSLDICQSVLGSFFVRAASGQYELNSPEQLRKLLVTMARNKLIKQVDRHCADRRDHRRLASEPVQFVDIAAGASPSRQVAARDLLQQAHQRLSEEERRLAELRSQGMDWAGVARELGGTAGGRRKQLDRALRRVACELGLEEDTSG